MVRKEVWYDLYFLIFIMLDLWPSMLSILKNVPCAFEKNMSSALRWNVLKIAINSICSDVSFTTHFLIGFLSGWSVHCCKWGVNAPHYYYVTIDFSFWLSAFALYTEVRLCWVHIYYNCYHFLVDWFFEHYVVSFFVRGTHFKKFLILTFILPFKASC